MMESIGIAAGFAFPRQAVAARDLDLSVDHQLLLKFNASFNLYIFRENIFASRFGHIFLLGDSWLFRCFPWIRRNRTLLSKSRADR